MKTPFKEGREYAQITTMQEVEQMGFASAAECLAHQEALYCVYQDGQEETLIGLYDQFDRERDEEYWAGLMTGARESLGKLIKG